MNTSGGPLTYRDKPLLFNTVNVVGTDIHGYQDTVNGSVRMLHFPKYGITLPSRESSSTGTLLAGYKKTTSYPGSYKMVNVVLAPPCPCEDCHYEYGLTIIGEIMNPGIFNSQFAPEGRPYFGSIPAIATCNGTKLADADILTIEDELITSITLDDGKGSYNSSSDANAPGGPGSIVRARRYYIVKTTDNADAAGFTLTHADGTTTVFSYDANTTAGAWGVNFNVTTTAIAAQQTVDGTATAATLNGAYMAIRLGADTYLVTSVLPGLLFTIGTMVNMTIEERGINLKAKSVNEMFYVQYDKDFATTYGLYWFEITDSATTFAQNGLDLSIFVNGTDHDETNSTGAGTANAVTDINVSQQTSHGVYGSAPTSTGNASVVIASVADITLWIELDSTATTTLSCAASSPSGTFPRLTNDEVWREFSQLPFDGTLRSQHRVPAPVSGDFVKYIIFTKLGTYGLHGASHGATYRTEITAYVAKAYAATFEAVLDTWLT